MSHTMKSSMHFPILKSVYTCKIHTPIWITNFWSLFCFIGLLFLFLSCVNLNLYNAVQKTPTLSSNVMLHSIDENPSVGLVGELFNRAWASPERKLFSTHFLGLTIPAVIPIVSAYIVLFSYCIFAFISLAAYITSLSDFLLEVH